MSAEELLNAQVAAADQAALTKAFNAAKRDDVKGLLKAQKEGRTYEYMDKWIPRDVKKRLSEERKKAPKLRARRVNHAGKRVPQKQATKSGGHSNGGMSSIKLSGASLSAFLAKEKTGNLSRGQAVARDSASQMSPCSMDVNTKGTKKTLVENKLPCQQISNIKANLVTTTNDSTNTKISSSKSSAKETPTVSSTPSSLNNRENICPTSIQSGAKGNATTASLSSLRTNLKPIRDKKSSTTKDPLSSLKARSTHQNNRKVGGTSSEWSGSKEVTETLTRLRKVDKSSPYLSSTPSNIKGTGAADPTSVTDCENGKQQSFIGGVKLRPVKSRQELPPVRSFGPKASPQRFSHSTGASSIPGGDKKNVRCGALSSAKNVEAVVSPVKKKEIVSSSIISPPPLKTSLGKVEANVPPPSLKKEEVRSKNVEAVVSPVKKKEVVSSSIISPPPLETSLGNIGANVPPLSFKKEVRSKNLEAVVSPAKKKEVVSSSIISPPPLETSLGKIEANVPPLSSFKKEDSGASIEESPIGNDVSKELEMAKYKTSTQDDVTPRVKLPPLTSTLLTQDHTTTSPMRVNNEIIPDIEDAAAAEPLLTPLETKAEKDRTLSASTPLNRSGPIEELEVTKYTINIEDVIATIDPKSTAASFSSSENTEDALVENNEEMGTTKLGRLSTFFGRLFRFGKKKKVSSKHDEISSPSTTNSSAVQESSSQEHDEIEKTTCSTDITTTVEQPSVETTTHYASGSLKRSLRAGKKMKKTAKRRKTTMANTDEPTTETDSSSKLLKRMWLFGGKKMKKSTKRRKIKLSCSEEMSVTATADLRGEKTTTTNDEEDPTATTFAAAAPHEKSLHSKKKKHIFIFGKSDKKIRKVKVSNIEEEKTWSTDCCASAKEKSTTTTTDATSIVQHSSSAASITKTAPSKLNGKKNDLKMKRKRGDGGKKQSAVKPIAKKAVAQATNIPLSIDAADNTPSTCLVLSSGSMSAATLKPKKKKKTKRSVKKSLDSKLTSTVQQLSSIKLASIAENALSKFMGEAKPKKITTRERIAREQAAFERSQQHYQALRLPPAGLLGLRHMRIASPQISAQKDSAMALNKSSFRRRVGIERRVSKHHCNTEMFCEVHVRMWHGHEDDASSSVWATQYAFLKLTEGVLWMGKAGAVMKEVALISKTCTLSHIQYVEDEDGKECVLVIIDDLGSCNGYKRYIQLCASTNEETKEFHHLLCLSNGC